MFSIHPGASLPPGGTRGTSAGPSPGRAGPARPACGSGPDGGVVSRAAGCGGRCPSSRGGRGGAWRRSASVPARSGPGRRGSGRRGRSKQEKTLERGVHRACWYGYLLISFHQLYFHNRYIICTCLDSGLKSVCNTFLKLGS